MEGSPIWLAAVATARGRSERMTRRRRQGVDIHSQPLTYRGAVARAALVIGTPLLPWTLSDAAVGHLSWETALLHLLLWPVIAALLTLAFSGGGAALGPRRLGRPSLYPPDAVVRFSRRFLMRGISPGWERLFWWSAVSGFAYIPAFVVLVMYRLSGNTWFLWPVTAVLMGSVSLFCGQWPVLAEEGRPLLSAWLRVASLAAWVSMFATLAIIGYLRLR